MTHISVRTFYLLILLVFVTIQAFGQTDDQIQDMLKTSEALVWSDPDSSISYVKSFLKNYNSSLDQSGRASIYMGISKSFNALQQTDSISYWANKASIIYDEQNDDRGKAEVLYQKAYASFTESAWDKSTELILEGLGIMESHGDERGIALGHLRMARIGHFSNQLQLSWDEGVKGGEIFAKLGLHMDAADAWSFAAHGFRVDENRERAKYCFDKSLEHAILSEVPDVMGMAYNGLCYFHAEFEELDQAIEYGTKALEYISQKNGRSRMIVNSILGQINIDLKEYEKSVEHLKAAVDYVTINNHIFYLSEWPEFLGEAYAGLNQYDSAYKYMQINQIYTDSLFKKEQDDAISEMKISYETEKKEVMIASQKRTLYAALGAIGLLTLLGFLLFQQYRQKKSANNALTIRNSEKDFLMKEIHHRVKNNLQILSSLLNLQSSYIKDEGALDALIEGRNRVDSMGLIHQRLYSNENVTSVDIAGYIDELCAHLQNTFSSESKSIKINADVKLGQLDIDTAIPLGLIINELITNAKKYAFENNQMNGEINVTLNTNDKDELVLSVDDNGSGKAEVVDEVLPTSFGTDLVRMLTKKLKGTISESSQKGYQVKIAFKKFNFVSQQA